MFTTLPTQNLKPNNAIVLAPDQDVLARSCSLFRGRHDNPAYLTLESSSITVTDEDIDLAGQIRAHYEKKLVVLKLKDIHVSQFRTCLAQFLSSKKNEYHREWEGMIYTLPYMYEYDQKMEDLIKNHSCFSNDIPNILFSYTTTNITFFSKIHRKSKNGDFFQYWFKTDTNLPLLISIERKNPLISIWDNLLEKNKTISIDGKFSCTRRYGYNHLTANSWSISNVV